ncbi:hypothetical protein CEXT_571421, partial [Caerostris extrusa]
FFCVVIGAGIRDTMQNMGHASDCMHQLVYSHRKESTRRRQLEKAALLLLSFSRSQCNRKEAGLMSSTEHFENYRRI